MASKMVQMKYSKNEVIFLAGDNVDRLFVIENGCIESYKDNVEGRRLTLWLYHPGDLFCLATLYMDSAFANAVALKNSTLYSLPGQTVTEILMKEPSLGVNFLQYLSNKLAGYSAMVDDLAFKDLSFRLMKLLFAKARHLSGNTAECTLSLENMASHLGTSKEVISRALKKLKEEDLVKRHGRSLVILDVNRLEEKISGEA